jgi:hypothetical protein
MKTQNNIVLPHCYVIYGKYRTGKYEPVHMEAKQILASAYVASNRTNQMCYHIRKVPAQDDKGVLK